MTGLLPSRDPLFYASKLGRSVIKSCFWLIILGIVFAVIPTLINTKDKNKFASGSYETNIFLTISSSLFASAILTATLSIAETRQRKRDSDEMLSKLNNSAEEMIRQIRNSSADTLLEELVGDRTIFDEINTHIIRKDCIRSSYRLRMRLCWLKKDNSSKKYLLKKSELTYSVKNTSSNRTVEYPIKVVEEPEGNSLHAKATRFLSVQYQVEGESEIVLKGKALSAKVERSAPGLPLRLVFLQNVGIPPQGKVTCCVKAVTVVDSSLSYPIISLTSTREMIVDIDDHPDELNIEAQLFHPSMDKLETLTRAPHAKCWRIVGLLPGQGVQISWRPKQVKPS
jgi:hypothetical protein